MGKIFTVEIEYSVSKHKALISVCHLHREPFFHVQFIDDFLQGVFQTEHIRYQGADGYQYCSLYEDEMGQIIIDRIAQAIERKLYGGTALIRKLFNDK